jgi:hypothetical protein
VPPANRAARRHPLKASEKNYLTLDTWAHDAIVEVDLGSGFDEIEMPQFEDYLIDGGVIPEPLVGIAQRYEDEGPALVTTSPEEKAAYRDLKLWMIATHLRKPNLVKDLGSEEAAIAWVREHVTSNQRSTLFLRCAFHITDAQLATNLAALAPFLASRAGDAVAGNGAANGQGPE